MKNIYLIWAILGTVLPVLCFLGVFHAQTPSLLGFVPAIFVNGWAAGFTLDLFISSFVFWTYMFRASEGPKPWLYIVLNLSVGLSLALPLYLHHVSRQTDAAVAAA